MVGPLDAHVTVDGSHYAVTFPDGRQVQGSLASAERCWLALAVVPR